MTRSSRLWRAATALYIVINLGGLGYGLANAEAVHAAVHAGLLVLGLGAYLVWRFARRAPRQDPARAQLAEERLDYLQQSVDAMALELERVGEAQRFSDKLRVERGETPLLKKDQ